MSPQARESGILHLKEAHREQVVTPVTNCLNVWDCDSMRCLAMLVADAMALRAAS